MIVCLLKFDLRITAFGKDPVHSFDFGVYFPLQPFALSQSPPRTGTEILLLRLAHSFHSAEKLFCIHTSIAEITVRKQDTRHHGRVRLSGPASR